MTIKQQGGIFGRNPTFNDVDVEGTLTVDGSAVPSPTNILTSSDIGVTVQGYDADTAKLDVEQTFTQNQTVSATLAVGNQTFTGSTHSITADYTISMSDADGGGVDIKKNAGEGSYPLYVTMQDLSNYTSGNAANYQQALQFYADAQNKFSGSGAELQILGEMRMEYDNTTLGFGSDQGAGKLMLRARQNSSDHTINNLKDHLVIHGFGGDVELGVGNLKVQSGKGIDFSATSGTGTSELFDDYEEGTWTPNLTFGDASVGITYAVQGGTYTKVGNLVTGRFIIVLSNKGSSTGTTVITGLPYTVGSDVGVASVEVASNFSTNVVQSGYAQNSTTGIVLNYFSSTGTGLVDNTNFNNNTRLDMWFSYFV